MAIITPQTDVYLLKCPLELNDANQITFATADAQTTYFQSLPKLHIGDDFTYQRKDGVMRVPALIDDLYGYNYCMYKNKGHSNKWFFAFITGMEYLNDSVTGISLKTDTYQTWMFDLTYKKTFVEREHVNDDTFGKHTVPENLEIGNEYVLHDSYSVMPFKDSWAYGDEHTVANKLPYGYMIAFQVSDFPAGMTYTTEYDSTFNGLFSGLLYFGVKNAADARKVINKYANSADAIVSIFYAPCSLFDGALKIPFYYDLTHYVDIFIPYGDRATDMLGTTQYAYKPANLDGYTPKNNKCFCYPYCYISVDNNAGDTAIYKFEDFGAETGYTHRASFNMYGALGQGCSIKLVPKNYKHLAVGKELYNYGLVGAKLPQCAWKSDYFTNWVTQNGINVGASAMSDSLSAAFGAMGGMMMAHTPAGATVAGLTAGIGIYNSISKSVAQTATATVRPDQAKGAVSACDLNIGYIQGAAHVYYTIQHVNIRSEYAKIVDDYFSMFGYKVNEVKAPNITGRRNWNFVKTVGCYIEANIPQDDLQEIKSMFDKGITFWHNPSTFMDYSQNNDII